MTPRPRKQGAPSSGFAVAYRRVSTDEQRESGLGLDAQTASIDQAAARAGLEVRASFTDAGLSGALPIDKRPQLAAAIAALKRGDVLLVAKRDRLARDVMQAAMIEAAARRKGSRIVSAAGEGTDTDDPTAQLMRTMIDAFAAYERMVIGARTAAALHAKAERGERYGTVRFGKQLAIDGRTLVDNPAERKLILLAAECRFDLGLSWQETADTLNREGYRTRAGTAWTLHGIRSALLTWQRHQPSGTVPERRRAV